MEKPIKFYNFLMLADVLATSIGLVPYDDESKPAKFQLLKKIIFLINIINLNIILTTEILYVVVAMFNGNHFMEAIMNLSYIGFVVVSDIKIFSVLQKKSLLTILMRELESIYPQEVQLQKSFEMRKYVKRFHVISVGFVILNEMLIWSYNLFTAVSYLIYEYWLEWRIIPRNLPYYSWVPWQWEGNWSYYMLYAAHNLGGFTCMSGQLANDVLLCVVATQFIMHYSYLAKCIENYKPKKEYEQNQKFLKEIIQYHQKILNLSGYMNEIFGVSLLVNFISSSFIMCFMGFLMTIGVQPDILYKLFMFQFCSLIQILMFCNYGQKLITESESIGHAVYNHQWFHTDLRYRKMLILVIKRSQKPVLMKATTFINVSMGTMTDLMQLSYKFYALLRTMYSK